MSDPRSARMEQDCQHLAQQNARLAARLAEVEAENAELIEKLKAGLSRDDRTSLSSLFGYDLGVEEGRAEGQAERDRLAQELEDAVEAMRKAARGPSPASAVTGFLARFPVEEGSHGR